MNWSSLRDCAATNTFNATAATQIGGKWIRKRVVAVTEIYSGWLRDQIATPIDPLWVMNRIHTGPAKYLCDQGAGHVCGEQDAPLSRFDELLAQMKTLHDAKRSDYTGTSGDVLHNYRNSAKLAGISMQQGMFARLCEKVIRISSVLSNGGETKVSDEKITDTYFDLAVISLLSIIASEEQERVV